MWLVPSAVRRTPWAVAHEEELASAGFSLADGALLEVSAVGQPDVHVVDDDRQGVDAFRRGAVEVLVWPRDAGELGAVLGRARERLEQRVRAGVIEAAWRAGGEWVEVTNEDPVLVDVNRGFEEESGYAVHEAVGRSPAELFRAGTHGPAFYAEVHQEARERGWRGGFVGRRRDGSWCVQDVMVGAFRIEDRVAAMYAIKRPVNAPASSPLAVAIAEHGAHPWWLVRRDGTIVEGSASARRRVAETARTLVDIGLGDIVLPEPGGRTDADRWVGDLAWEVRCRGLLVGDVELVLVVLHDVTERRLREEELDRAARELAKARDEAKAANTAKSTFLAGISHELRTPLNAILGYSELLEEVLVGEESHDATRIHLAGRQLLELVDDLLDLARIEAGRVEVVLEPVDLREVLEDVADTLQLKAMASEQRIEIVGEPVTLSSDRRRLRQIVLNLAGNATKYAVPGRIVLGSSGGEHPTLWVEDEGPGIGPDQLERLFQPYTQLGEGAGGVGLGLSICRGLASLLGGDLQVRSAVGEGTRFTLRW
ncbi:MAG: PAS domain-containing sensor histidine kinase [Alphaproteobacteria bacterium]|nr:PAS domain-containing sensor histidine kinase [Alphaproteobacteria bacterium]MCB9699267.1 PAS domain-containing sensor histidine kinase [Alphaproteobacteria bacterium]